MTDAWTPKTVALSDIDDRVSPQMRVGGLDAEHVDSLVAAKGELPRVVLVRDHAERVRYLIVDGFHRVAAARKAGRRTIEASIIDGHIDDAFWLACAANKRNGLSRSPADKRKAVATALRSPRGHGLSDRAIAEHCGVSHQLVGEVRAESGGRATTSKPKASESHGRREGKDGKSYPAKSSKVLPRRPLDEDDAERDAVRAEGLGPGAEARVEAGKMLAAAEGGEPRDMPVHVGGASPTFRDEVGTALPGTLATEYAAAKRWASDMLDALGAARRLVASGKADVTRGRFALGRPQTLDGLGRELATLEEGFRALVPHAVCPACRGEKCEACEGRGWLARATWERLGKAAAE